MDDRLLLKVGGWAAIVGAVLALVVNLLAPRPDTEATTDPTALADVAATSGRWAWISIGVTLALLALLVAFYAVARSVDGAARVWANLGLGAFVIGTITGTAAHAINAGLHEGAETLPPEVLDSASFVSEGIGSLWTLTYFGFAPLLLGVALLTASHYPNWLGGVTLTSGLVGLAAGMIQSVAGPTQLGTFVLFPITSVLLTLVFLYLGWFLLQRVPEAVTDRASSSSQLMSDVRGDAGR